MTRRKKIVYTLTGAVCLLVIYLGYSIIVFPPEVADKSATALQVIKVDSTFYKVGDSWLKKNEYGVWEMYVQGNAFERGVKAGKLTKELSEFQETAFIGQLKKMIPSKIALNLMRFVVAWYNRNLEANVTNEYQQEIYGISLSASDKFDYVGPKYQRILYYHAAHDIGHAMQDRNMVVGCTSFAVNNQKSADGKLLIGRNFDFYVGDDFAKNKIVEFVNPTEGVKFMMVTWAGMIGAVSGMNEKGITVTINASKAAIPSRAATPISLLAREILQYATNINDAKQIAQKRKTFVAESLLIGSAADHKAVIIEKAPDKMDVYETNEPEIICPNHFQGSAFTADDINMNNIKESTSLYRFKRMKQLIDRDTAINYMKAAEILRDQKGMDDKDIGFANEKSINQLMAHHSIIFKPEDELVWVSTAPFQLGKFICYDLNKVFRQYNTLSSNTAINEDALTIPADTFLQTPVYLDYLAYMKEKEIIQKGIKSNVSIAPQELSDFVHYNPEYYFTYELVGDYYKSKHAEDSAAVYYSKVLDKEIATLDERNQISKNLAAILNVKKQ